MEEKPNNLDPGKLYEDTVLENALEAGRALALEVLIDGGAVVTALTATAPLERVKVRPITREVNQLHGMRHAALYSLGPSRTGWQHGVLHGAFPPERSSESNAQRRSAWHCVPLLLICEPSVPCRPPMQILLQTGTAEPASTRSILRRMGEGGWTVSACASHVCGVLAGTSCCTEAPHWLDGLPGLYAGGRHRQAHRGRVGELIHSSIGVTPHQYGFPPISCMQSLFRNSTDLPPPTRVWVSSLPARSRCGAAMEPTCFGCCPRHRSSSSSMIVRRGRGGGGGGRVEGEVTAFNSTGSSPTYISPL